MKIVFFGTPEFSIPSLRELAQTEHELILVVTRPDKPVGRRRTITSPPIVEVAQDLGIDVIQPKNLKGESAANRIKAAAADVAVVVAYGKIIPPHLLEIPPLGMVNLHPSLLPRHRGPSPIQWALVSGDRVTGVTTMLLDEGMDTGPILLQERVEIDRRENAEMLSKRLADLGAGLVVRTLDRLRDGDLEARAQPNKGATVTPMLRREFGQIDWSRPSVQLVNRLRGFTPWPGIHTAFRGDRLKIFGLEEVTHPAVGRGDPGTVISVGQDGIVVRCGGQTSIRITEVQREGRRRLPVDAFLIGERVVAGEQFG